MKDILIIPDKFKGTLSDEEICDTIEKALDSTFRNYNITKIPLADGGEGSMKVITNNLKGEFINIQAHNPIMDMINSTYGWIESTKTAVIEMSQASGLMLLREQDRNPMNTTTIGTGEIY